MAEETNTRGIKVPGFTIGWKDALKVGLALALGGIGGYTTKGCVDAGRSVQRNIEVGPYKAKVSTILGKNYVELNNGHLAEIVEFPQSALNSDGTTQQTKPIVKGYTVIINRTDTNTSTPSTLEFLTQ